MTIKGFDIKYTYFKSSGKYYSEGEECLTISTCGGDDGPAYMYDVVDHVKEVRKRNLPLPGLNSAWNDGYILIDCEEGHPHLILPESHYAQKTEPKDSQPTAGT